MSRNELTVNDYTIIAKELMIWVKNPENNQNLAEKINAGLTEYDEYHKNDANPLAALKKAGKSVSSFSLFETAKVFVSAGASVVRFAYSSVNGVPLSNRMQYFRHKFPNVNANNAQQVFIDLKELGGDWAVENYLGAQRPSLTTLIFSHVFSSFLAASALKLNQKNSAGYGKSNSRFAELIYSYQGKSNLDPFEIPNLAKEIFLAFTAMSEHRLEPALNR